MKVIYYLDVTSSWCFWNEPAWAELQQQFAGAVLFEWRVALMDPSGLPTSTAQIEWFYRRSGTIMRSTTMLNSGWFEAGLKEYLAPNAVALAARSLGAGPDTARVAISEAGLLQGRRIGTWEESVAIAAQATNIPIDVLAARANSQEILDAMRATTAEYHALKVNVRPAYVLENSIGDRAVFSGIVNAVPIAATIRTMLDDARAYDAFAAHFGGPPPN